MAKTTKKQFDVVGMTFDKVTIKIMKGGYSDIIGRRLPGGMSFRIDLGALGKKKGKREIGAISFVFDLKKAKQIRNFINKNLKG